MQLDHQNYSSGLLAICSMIWVAAMRHCVLMFSFTSNKSFSRVPTKLSINSIMKELLYFYSTSLVTNIVMS